jgi:hypothetical protein
VPSIDTHVCHSAGIKIKLREAAQHHRDPESTGSGNVPANRLFTGSVVAISKSRSRPLPQMRSQKPQEDRW